MSDFFTTYKPKDPLEQYTNMLQLTALQQQIDNAPVEAKAKQIDAALKANQLLNVDMEREKLRIDTMKAKNDEARAQSNFFMENAKALPGLFNMSFELGAQAASRLGMAAVKQKDGTIGLAIPNPQGGAMTLAIDPKRQGDPDKIVDSEKQLRSEWVKAGDDFRVIDNNFKIIEVGRTQRTGASDLGMIFALAKIYDRQSVVRDGEREVITNTTNLPGWLVQAYEKQKNSSAPMLNETQRVNMYAIARTLHADIKSKIQTVGRFYNDLADRSGYNAKNILVPIGSLRMEEILGEPGQASTMPASGTAPSRGLMPAVPTAKPTPAVKASLMPEEPEEKKIEPVKYQTTDELLRNQLFRNLR